VLLVPDVGHSVLGSDPSGCSGNALQALFANKPIKPCSATALPPLLRPSPLPPARLADVAPAAGTRGRAGATLHAVVLTLADLQRQLQLKLLPLLASGLVTHLTSLRVGGLRAGWGESTPEALILRRFSYVPGVSVSGKITAGEATLHVGGPAAAGGTLRLGARESLGGVLGGVPVQISAESARASDRTSAARLSALLRLYPGAASTRGGRLRLVGLLGGR
jgi:hypothetical protein